MNISDEQLSAFLDAELPEAEMEAIREQLILDENIANRLAELAMVDEVVAAAYTKIDSRPLPDSIAALLAEDTQVVEDKNSVKENPKTAKIIAFPLFQTFQNALQKHMAIAASVVMVLGFGAIQLLHETNTNGNWQEVAKVLETAPSGVQISTHGVEIKPRLTFTNKQGEYCRQFIMTHEKSTTENIACRKQGEWKVAVSVTLDKSQEANTYQTASGGSLLDSAVEDMANGDFFDAQDETQVIERQWSEKKQF
jgi:negative regulator of sigma E activity